MEKEYQKVELKKEDNKSLLKTYMVYYFNLLSYGQPQKADFDVSFSNLRRT